MRRRRAGIAIGAVASVVAVTAALVMGMALLQPVSTAVTAAGLEVECSGMDEAACATWAESVLGDGPGIHTFDPADLERVRLGRSFLGLFGDCQAEYVLGRFDDVAARETVPCPAD